MAQRHFDQRVYDRKAKPRDREELLAQLRHWRENRRRHGELAQNLLDYAIEYIEGH